MYKGKGTACEWVEEITICFEGTSQWPIPDVDYRLYPSGAWIVSDEYRKRWEGLNQPCKAASSQS